VRTLALADRYEPKEIAMTRLHQHIRRAAAILAGLTGLAAALVASGATPALAGIRIPDPGGYVGVTPPLTPTVTRTVVVGGMPGWQIALIAAGAALLAATVAVLLDRARATHRKATMSAS
jgi:hypothetical protein